MLLQEGLIDGKRSEKGPLPMHYVPLSDGDIAILHRTIRGQGGFQSLFRKLQRQINQRTRMLGLDDSDREKCVRYATKYGTGGWQARLLRAIVRKVT